MSRNPLPNRAVGVFLIVMLSTSLLARPVHATGGTADNVIGQINFVNDVANFVDGSGLYGPSAMALDPVGGEFYVADSLNHRVLGWASTAAFVGNLPADVVIGQNDSYSYYCNQNSSATSAVPGTPGPNTLCSPNAVAVDGAENVYVADSTNNRVLVYTNPFAAPSGQNSGFNARLVFGQGTTGKAFTFAGCAVGSAGLCFPSGVAVDRSGDLFVADGNNNRVLEYFSPLASPIAGAGDVVADVVLGQTDFNGDLPNQGNAMSDATLWTSKNWYGEGSLVTVDQNNNLYVNDPGNDRVVVYNGPFSQANGPHNDPFAWLVFNGYLTSATGMAVDALNNVYIAANGLIYRYPQNFNPPTNVVPDLFLRGGTGLSALTDGLNNLYVADPTNNRILEYFAPGPAAGTGPGASGDILADLALGQIDLVKTARNFIDGRGLNWPGAVAIDSSNPGMSHVYIVDTPNNRVLGWRTPNGAIGHQPADLVIGQPDFFSYDCNQTHESTAQTLCGPSAVAIDKQGNVFVADDSNGRVLEFANPFNLLPGQNSNFAATTVFGQGGNFTGNVCTRGLAPSASSLCGPSSLAVDPYNNLFASDVSANRVLEFRPDALGGFGSTPTAISVFGQGGSFTTPWCADGQSGRPAPSPTTLNGSCSPPGPPYYAQNLGVAADRHGNLYVADAFNNRVLEFTPISPGNFGTVPAANKVFGQGANGTGAEFSTNFCNGSSAVPSATTLCVPAAVTIDLSGNVFVSDIGNNRVLEYDEGGSVSLNVTANHVFGQADFAGNLCNEGNLLPSATSMCPRTGYAGIATQPSGSLYAADSGNNRVLQFNQPVTISTSLSASSVSFGPQVLGSKSGPRTISISNTGEGALIISSVSGTGDFVESNNCGTFILPGNNCSVSISFLPTAAGLRTGVLKVADNAGSGSQVVALYGTGIPPVNVSALTLAFGQIKVGQASGQALAVANNQAVSMALVASFSGTNATDFGMAKVGTCGTSIAPQTKCSYAVVFAPRQSGARSATLTITGTPDASSPHTVALSGTGS
jgi:sugar lactone lactonase YvrE